MAPTTAIETVLVVRPLKVTAFSCGFVSAFLLILSISTSAWLTTDDIRRGLWSVCDIQPNNTINCTAINLKVDCANGFIQSKWKTYLSKWNEKIIGSNTEENRHKCLNLVKENVPNYMGFSWEHGFKGNCRGVINRDPLLPWPESLLDHQEQVTTCITKEFEDGILTMASKIVPGWYLGVACLMTIGLFIVMGSTIICGIGLASSSIECKYKYYRTSMYIMILAIVLLVTGLIVLPVMFSKRINIEESEWYFAWAYGVAWGGTIFAIGSAVLLYIDKETEEIFFEEKTYYHDNEGAEA